MPDTKAPATVKALVKRALRERGRGLTKADRSAALLVADYCDKYMFGRSIHAPRLPGLGVAFERSADGWPVRNMYDPDRGYRNLACFSTRDGAELVICLCWNAYREVAAELFAD